MESLTIISKSERRKKLEVKGGFYSKDDMKNELGYAQTHSSIKSVLHESFRSRSRDLCHIVSWYTRMQRGSYLQAF